MRRTVLLFLSSFLLGCPAVATAQTSAEQEVGANLNKSYASGDFDHVEVQNGNVYARLPLVSFPQLGKLNLSFSLAVNGSAWSVTSGCDSLGSYCWVSYLPTIPSIGTPVFSEGDGVSGSAGSPEAGADVVWDQELSYTRSVNWDQIDFDIGYAQSGEYTYTLFDASGAAHPMAFDEQDLTRTHDVDGLGYTLQVSDWGVYPGVP